MLNLKFCQGCSTQSNTIKSIPAKPRFPSSTPPGGHLLFPFKLFVVWIWNLHHLQSGPAHLPHTWNWAERMDCMIPAPRATWPLPVRKAGFRAAQKRLVFFMMRRNSWDNRRQQETASRFGCHSRTQRYRGQLGSAGHLMGGKDKILEAWDCQSVAENKGA